MPEVSGTWTGANHIAVIVYRGALAPSPTSNDGLVMDGTINVNSATVTYSALSPSTYPAAAGTGWYASFVSHSTATNVETAVPTGMSLIANAGAEIAVCDTAAAVSTNYAGNSFGLNASGVWATCIVQVPASGTVSRVGAGAADADNIAIPAGHQVGDLILIWTARYGSSLAGKPSDYTTLNSRSSISIGELLAYKIVTVPDFIPRIAVY